MDKQEYWDIYDIDHHPTGKVMLRNDFHMEVGEYHLSVLGIVTDLQGRFLITRRKEDKLWAPGAYEVPGGGVQAGESSEAAVRREVTEETGLDAMSAERVTLVGSYHNDDPGHDGRRHNYIVDIYHLEMDFEPGDVHTQEEETSGYRIVTIEEIRAFGSDEAFLHYSRLLPIMEQISLNYGQEDF